MFQVPKCEEYATNVALIVSIAILGETPLVHAEPMTRIIAVSGDPTPDGNGVLSGIRFPGATAPSLNDAGQVGFLAELHSTRGELGVFIGGGAELVQVAVEGESAPGGAGVFHSFITGFNRIVSINDDGDVAFPAILTDIQSKDQYSRVYRFDGSEFTEMLGFGYDRNQLSDTGQMRGDGNEEAFLFDGATAIRIAGTGDPAPDGNGTMLDPSVAALNDEGQAAVFAEFLGTQSGQSDNEAILRGDGATLEMIAREGNSSPDGNGMLGTFQGVSINNSGQVSFYSDLTDTRGGEGENRVILRGDGTGLTVIARDGDLAPDGKSRLSVRAHPHPSLNDVGQVAFLGWTGNDGSRQQGIFRGDGDTLTRIARGGDEAPGGNGTFSRFEGPALNNGGQVAFSARLTDPSGAPAEGRLGIFHYDDGHGLNQVARVGDPLLDSLIRDVTFAGHFFAPYDEWNGFNELGQVAYGFALADGRSGIAIWSVPEPSGLASIVVAIIWFAMRCRIMGRH